MTTGSTQKVFAACFVATITWLSILFQLYLTHVGTVNFFSYFTTLCNLLIAVSLTLSTLFPSTSPGVYFRKLTVQSAIALYILIVSIVYNVALRGIWVLTGWEYVLDNMVHVVNPILYVLYWLLFRTQGSLKLVDVVGWIAFPFIYLLYSLIRGALISWYPYPFLDAAKFGYPKVFTNIAVMLIVFLLGGLLLITATNYRRFPKKQN